jgi:Zn-finger nucleic acid-binding protein
MRCVACKKPMVVLELEQIEIDYCLACSGIWLDSGELELLVDRPLSIQELFLSKATGQQSNRGTRKCPICRRRMDITEIGAQKPVQIDHCPQDHGFWFDRGELEEIIGILAGGAHSRVADLLHNMFQDNNTKAGG